MTPRLTIAIPTVDRPELMARAIDSCLAQTVPVKIIVCDQGGSKGTFETIIRYTAEQIFWVPTGAKTLWGNWQFGARHADTEFFAWLQDDDVIAKGFANRVVSAFDGFPNADVWMARNMLAVAPDLSWWNNGNGPWVPMDILGGKPDQWEGQILTPTSYFTSWSLSPAVAFRRGARFDRALDSMPKDFDLFQERLILAYTAYDGHFIADPVIAGLWMQHGDNESQKQHHDQPRQTAILVDVLDDLMDKTEGWRDILFAWCGLMHPTWILGWLNQLGTTQTEGKVGQYTESIRDVLVESLKGRVEVVRPVTSAEQGVPQADLKALARHHGTDKDRDGCHEYARHYERILAPYHGRKIILLEIGIGGFSDPKRGGESLKMWADYFPLAEIHGIDIHDKWGLDTDRIITHQGSQTDLHFLAKVVDWAGAPDVVIDDGSHRSADTIVSFGWLFPRLAPGGVYVVEDARTSYEPEYGGNPDGGDPLTTLGYFRSLVDEVNGTEGPESGIESIQFIHNLIVIRKAG